MYRSIYITVHNSVRFYTALPLGRRHVFRRAGSGDGGRAQNGQCRRRGELHGLHFVAHRFSVRSVAVSRTFGTLAEHRSGTSGAVAAPADLQVELGARKCQHQQYED